MLDIILFIIKILIFPGLLFAVAIGLLLAGIDRKVLARMQHRVGPPIRQPFFDFMKLMGKENIIPQNANKAVYLGAPIVGFISLVVMMLLIPIGGYTAFSSITSFKGEADLIVILYLLTIPAVALIVGGSASGSPYAGIGISREMVTMIGYELPLIVVFLAVAKLVANALGGQMTFSLQVINDYQDYIGPIITHWAMLPAAVAMLLIIPAEVGTQPFDVAEAETEICEGPLVEYSGPPLAMFKLNTAVKMLVMSSLFVSLFLGGITSGIHFEVAIGEIYILDIIVKAIIHVVLCIIVTVISMTTLHAISARLKIEHLFKFYWTFVTALAAASLIMVWIGL